MAGGVERMFMLPGQILGVSKDRMQLVDLASRQRIASWPLSSAGSAKAQWSAGKLWLGGSDGLILQPLRGSAGMHGLYDSGSAAHATSGVVEDLVLQDGQLLLAADNFGAQFLRQDGVGSWQSTLYPSQAFTEAASRVDAGGAYWFLLQDQRQQVVALNRSSMAAQVVFQNQPMADLAVGAGYLVVASGGGLQLASLAKLDSKRSISVSSESLQQLTAYGSQVVALSESGRVFLVDLREEAMRPVLELTAQLGGEVSQLIFNGAQLFYLSAGNVWRYDLHSQQRSQMLAGTQINQIYGALGLLWVEQRMGQGQALVAVDPRSGEPTAGGSMPLAKRTTALAAEQNRLAIGFGTDGVKLYELPYGLGSADASPLAPLSGALLPQGGQLQLELAEIGVQRMDFAINGQRVGALSQPLNMSVLRLPSSLPQGQSFGLTVRSEDSYGVVRESLPRNLHLQAGDGIANAFAVGLSYAQHSWLPTPLAVTAEINGSTQPIAQVEVLVAAAANGPWQRVALRNAEPFRASLLLDGSYSGQYIEARAVDVFGNVAESQPGRFYRHQDLVAPSAALSYEGAATFVDVKKAVRGYPFIVKAQMSDDGALDKATLLRNGQVVAVAFGQEQLSYQDSAANLGEQVYSLEVQDRAGNASSSELRVTVIDDAYPVIEALATPAEIVEQGSFTVQLTTEDDVAVKAVEVAWNGFTDRYEINAKRLNAQSFVVKDRRTERVASSLTESLRVKVIDGRGQTSEAPVKTIKVLRDKLPNAAALQISLPARGVYGGLINLQLANLAAVDDTSGLQVRVLHVAGAERQELFSCLQENASQFGCAGGLYNSSYSRDLRLPSAAQAGDQYRLQVEMIDRMGQTASRDLVVALNQAPNLLRFRALQAGDNPEQARVQDRPVYRVQVLDAASQPVPDQPVQWRLRRMSDGSVSTLGTLSSDAQGYSSLTLNTDRSVGDYQLWADLPQFSQIARAEQNLSISSGPTRNLLLGHLPPMAAGDSAILTVQARDQVSNLVSNDQSTVLELVMPTAEFHVQPGPGIDIASTSLNGQTVERVRATLKNGQAQLSLQAGQQVGQFSMPISSAGNNLYYTYNSGGAISCCDSQIRLTVVPAAPARVQLLNDQGVAQADGDVLHRGIKQDVRLQLHLQDRFGNPVSQLAGKPANLGIQVKASGTASVNGQAAGASVDLVNGQAWLAVNNEAYEESIISLQGPVEGCRIWI